MSTLSQFSGGGVKSIQTGYVQYLTSTGTGTGEEGRYWDITVSAVSDITKCIIQFDGSAVSLGNIPPTYNSSTYTNFIPTTKLVNSTTLRIMIPTTLTALATGRWTITEYY